MTREPSAALLASTAQRSKRSTEPSNGAPCRAAKASPCSGTRAPPKLLFMDGADPARVMQSQADETRSRGIVFRTDCRSARMIVLYTDFGPDGIYVAQVKAVLLEALGRAEP